MIPVIAAVIGTASVSGSAAFEYRVERVSMRPLSLNDLTASRVDDFDQRLRARLDLGYGAVSLHLQADLLDGVLFGDNGPVGGDVERNRGSVVQARSPNLSTFAVGQLDPSGSPTDRSNYGLVLVPAQPLTLRHAYGEAELPIGVLRAGRQPLTEGREVLVNSGDRTNRWGISRSEDTADAIAFGTKLDGIPDASRGVFAGALFGQIVQNSLTASEGLRLWAATVFYRDPALQAGLVAGFREGDQFDTKILALSGHVEWATPDFRASVRHAEIIGQTREISATLAALSPAAGPPGLQSVLAFGGFGEVALRLLEGIGLWASFEVYYASGNDQVHAGSRLTQLTLAPDTNVGLHLFKNIVAYETARSAKIGATALAATRPPTLAVADLATQGGLTDAVALFPQLLAAPCDWLALRTGVLFAPTIVPVVDPVGTLLSSSGRSVNYNGGAPGSYWGTEIDFGLTATPVPGLLFDAEVAYVIPGDALFDANGDAVRSLFLDFRLTYLIDTGG
jgi:hypothetical protein